MALGLKWARALADRARKGAVDGARFAGGESLVEELTFDAGVSRVISAVPYMPALVAPADAETEAWSNLGDLALRMQNVTSASDHASVFDVGELEAATVFGRIQLAEGDQRAAGEAILAASRSR